MPRNRRIDDSEPAHLRDVDGYSPPIHRFAPSPELADVVRRHWIPVWSLPEGGRSVQRVLQYPVCNLVIEASYAIVVGPTTGLSTRELTGSGWALGAMLQPAAGALLLGGAVSEFADTATPLEAVPGLDGAALVDRVRSALAGQPGRPRRNRRP